jgi:hypothetical protein
MDEKHADEQKRVLKLGLGIILVLVAVAAVLYFTVLKKPAPAPAAVKAAEETAKPAATGTAAATEGSEPLVLPAVGLDQSDPVVREYAKAISSSLRFGQWLGSKELVRKFVAAVDNIANGLSPRPQVDFWAPEGQFKAVNKPAGTFIDESKYSRYDPAAEVFASLDARAAVRFYRGLRPLIQEAYRDLGYPDTDFSDTLVKAMAELLDTPVVERPVKLEKKILSYVMADESLESLSQAQKQLLRMGPKNVRLIQGKIRELAAALGIPEDKLPRTRVLSTGGTRP